MLGYLRRRRRARLRALPVPEPWRAIMRRAVPLYERLPAERRAELEGHVQVLLAEKHWEGCGGLALTDEMRVTIAGTAALLLLGRETDYFPALRSILVYPDDFRVTVSEEEGGIVSEREEVRHGESWHRGAVVLSWSDARGGAIDPRDGYNVILHEFAHQLDQADGEADGVPPLAGREAYAAWARAMAPEFERLRAAPALHVLDPYGAEDAAEFFAVATEAFFERPAALAERHAALYAALRDCYRLDPAALAAPDAA